MPLITINMTPAPEDWQCREIERSLKNIVTRHPGLDEYQLIIRIPENRSLYFRDSSWSMALIETALFENETSESSELQTYCQAVTSFFQTMFQIAPERILIPFSKIDRWSMAGHLLDLQTGPDFFSGF